MKGKVRKKERSAERKKGEVGRVAARGQS